MQCAARQGLYACPAKAIERAPTRRRSWRTKPFYRAFLRFAVPIRVATPDEGTENPRAATM